MITDHAQLRAARIDGMNTWDKELSVCALSVLDDGGATLTLRRTVRVGHRQRL